MSAILYSAKYSGFSPEIRMFSACRARYSSANLSNSASSMASGVCVSNELHVALREQRADARARQRVALGGPGIRPVRRLHPLVAGMAHELHGAGSRQSFQHRDEILLVEPAAEVKPHEVVAAPQP